jgi:hypothetical protein
MQVKHLGESEKGLRCAIRVNRPQATTAAGGGEDADVTGSPSEKCKRSQKQLEPGRAPFS